MTTGVDRIRRYRESDRDAVYDICARTGATGGDARGLWSTDDLLPDLFAGPYLHLEPELALMLTDDDRAVGYIVGAADTARFVQVYRDVWIPLLGDKYSRPPQPPLTPEEGLLDGHFHPEHRLRPELADYPAHLHIDILPEHQGAGHGRALMQAWLEAAATAGAPAVFLHMDPENERAEGFYRRMGFRQIDVPGWGLHLGRATA